MPAISRAKLASIWILAFILLALAVWLTGSLIWNLALVALVLTIKPFRRFLWRLGPRVTSIVGVATVAFAIVFLMLDTKRDVAYRYSAPGSPACNTQLLNQTILAADKIDNDELAAIGEMRRVDKSSSAEALTCMLQLHAMKPGFVPENQDRTKGNPALGYYLSFLEFEENGNPAQIGLDGKLIASSQIDALFNHLEQQKKAGRQNFVFTFIHGWRHDARIGDDNVKNVRLMAAHLASFLQQRCEHNARYCGATVTAVYIGWRGARINEQRLESLFGGYFRDSLSAVSNLFASITLFDRKPVSERIAPAVISALREIDRQIRTPFKSDPPVTDWFKQPRLIVVGHSLGGNLLATGLKERMVEIVERNLDALQRGNAPVKPDESRPLVKPPLGDLIVLLNPASEAENWIAHQRAFRQRLNTEKDSKLAQTAYAVRQPPIYISLTAAHSWPANGLHLSDVAGFKKAILAKAASADSGSGVDPAKLNDCAAIRAFDGDYRPTYNYDSATYDLFPFFRFDFRPMAQTLEDKSDPNLFNCNSKLLDADVSSRPNAVKRWLLRGLAAALRNFPFMNTNVEQTRTIGHVDPMRPPFGKLGTSEQDPATWYGTTHELLINSPKKEKPPGEDVPTTAIARYLDAASPEQSECAVVDKWLSTVRSSDKYAEARSSAGTRVNWDSGWSKPKSGKIVPGETNKPNLTTVRPTFDKPAEYIESQIRQTLYFSGTRSITGANDPFWNVRAYETAMTSHNGYISYPLICSIFQFVMDKITDDTSQ